MNPAPSRGLLLLLVAALLAQAVLFAVPHQVRPLAGDQAQYAAEAERLALGAPLHPTFLWPPLYGRWLGGFFALFGPVLLPVKLVQAGLLLIAGLLFHALLRAAGIRPGAALVASGLLLCDPQLAAFAHYLWPEILHLFLSLLGVSLMLLSGPKPRLRCLLAGAVFGLALLAKSLLGPFVPVLVLVAAWAPAAVSARERLGRGAAVALGTLLLTAPVVVGNGLAHGTWSLSNSAQLNLWIGVNDPEGRGDYDSVARQEVTEYLLSSPSPRQRERIVRWRLVHKVSEEGLGSVLGEQLRKQYPRLLDKDSFFTDQLPGGRWGPPASHDWRTALLRGWAYGAYGLVLGLASLGLFQLRGRRGWAIAALPLAFLAFNLALFLGLHVTTRYRVAFLPCLAFFAAVAVDRGLGWLRGAGGRRLSRAGGLRLLGGALLAGVAWAAAFGR